MSRRSVLLIATLALAACGPAENDPGPGGVTVGEARALDDAASMLDKQTEEAAAGNSPVSDKPVSEAPATQ